ncbi:unnamed protein product, partial [Ixodes pacificus]
NYAVQTNKTFWEYSLGVGGCKHGIFQNYFFSRNFFFWVAYDLTFSEIFLCTSCTVLRPHSSSFLIGGLIAECLCVHQNTSCYRFRHRYLNIPRTAQRVLL